MLENKNSKITSTMSTKQAAIFGLLIVFFLFQFGGGALYLLIFGSDIKSANINALRLFNVAGQLLFILAPAIIFAKLVYVENLSTIFRIKKPTTKEILAFVVGLIILIPLLQSLIYVQNYLFQQLSNSFVFFESIKEFADKLDEIMSNTYLLLLNASSVIEIIFVVIIVSISPAICEEFFFRGFVQKSFEFSLKPFWAIFITSFSFALYHFNPYGLFALFILAFYLGFSAYQSNSILIPVILHFINNFVSVISYFIWGSTELINTNIVKEEEFVLHLLLFSLLTILFLAYIFILKKNYAKIS